ncbi:tagatose-6-phosphate kinase [Streptococcus ruminantium]|uniref:Tagatose-6-phosphate kinase n=1 Tax=Streptococcus ruminantium TaxID=1917441 RepID=A0ABU1B1B3_9STRE|nr:tagatose-6-phosphate kinase [Streptococcus ruminantium]MDQ8758393.1 tagatose-6-phosphate kinase [Streptococcus ruminantium]MDQ8764679.1 tagatose-6-phosphate kinase [Streptococcus ruminantium]MDQ8768927.1 tagatose-6-phosphate kinase [Streptococcus ruminantium]MDQ8773856.1 tagatose-6-phosphate kinase [Streptococcus ruminantium]MDQ8794365.1 tagatose-6-phosphate kinase [Streptococcus ruminantium]
MIVTITLNPSVDISYHLDSFHFDRVNRVEKVRKTAGGKGLNVTRVLHQIGGEVVATGFVGGQLGNYLKQDLTIKGIEHSFVEIEGETRNCIAILHGGQQTELLEQGPTIHGHESLNFVHHLETLLKNNAELVVISGSLPKGLPVHFYVKVMEICQRYNVKVVLDCSGEPLKKVLTSASKPVVIKPNIEELSQLIGIEVTNNIEQLKTVLSEKLFEGIEWIIVSLGAQGAFAKHNDTFYQVKIPKIRVVNPVGSGDSTVAGIAASLVHNSSDVELLKNANVLGMLNAQEEQTGYVNTSNSESLLSQITVTEV